ERASLAMCREIAGPGAGVLAGDLTEAHESCREAGSLGVDDRIRPVGADDAARPTARADRGVMSEVIERRFGRGEHLDAEPLEEGARAKGVLRQALGDAVVGAVGVAGSERRL